MVRGLKFRIYEEEGLYYLCSENKGADQLICTFVFAYVNSRFSHDAAHNICTFYIRYFKPLLASVFEQTGLNLNWADISKTRLQAPIVCSVFRWLGNNTS